MAERHLAPWSRESGAARFHGDPFLSLQREMNRLFDDAFRGFGPPAGFGPAGFPAGADWPRIEVAEGEKQVRISAELPGMTEKDVEVTLEDGVLILRGEKRSETKDEERRFSELFYGSFERRIPVDRDIDPEAVKASFSNGVLTVAVPIPEAARQRHRRIPVNGG